jgi:cytochrome c oxidase subunit 2
MQPNPTFLDQLKQGFMPILASEHGKDVDHFILIVHYLMAALFVGWLAYFLYALFRFRKSANPKADYTGAKGTLANNAEIAVVIVEAILLVAFAIPLWAKAVEKFPADKDATVMRVVAEQFSWQARYPGEDGKFGTQDMKLISDKNPLGYVEKNKEGEDDRLSPPKDIHVPLIPVKVDGRDSFKPVIVHVTSKDVIHSFKLTAMRLTQDCIPGMSLAVHFVPTKVGKFSITCAQLCGNGHASMNGLFVVDSPEDFNKWMAEKTTKAAGGAASFE